MSMDTSELRISKDNTAYSIDKSDWISTWFMRLYQDCWPGDSAADPEEGAHFLDFYHLSLEDGVDATILLRDSSCDLCGCEGLCFAVTRDAISSSDICKLCMRPNLMSIGGFHFNRFNKTLCDASFRVPHVAVWSAGGGNGIREVMPYEAALELELKQLERIAHEQDQ